LTGFESPAFLAKLELLITLQKVSGGKTYLMGPFLKEFNIFFDDWSVLRTVECL